MYTFFPKVMKKKDIAYIFQAAVLCGDLLRNKQKGAYSPIVFFAIF